MSFYDEIAAYYDYIFPFNEAQAGFTKNCLGSGDGPKKILDVGCGTGDLAIALSSTGYEVTGIDADKSMLEKARLKAGTQRIIFHTMDMRDMAQSFKASTFDIVLCFGNTLVHLNNLPDITRFCKDARTILSAGGKLLLQILNYDHILDDDVRSLPVLENDVILFERRYDRYGNNNLIRFETTLTIKAENRRIENAIPLYPLRRQELDTALRNAGFIAVSYYGDFDRRPLETNSLPLVVEATKPSLHRG